MQLSDRCSHLSSLGGRAILLIRDPWKAIISHRNLDAGGHKTFADPKQFEGESELWCFPSTLSLEGSSSLFSFFFFN